MSSKKDSTTKLEKQKKSRQNLQIKQVKVTKKIDYKTAEETFERTPEYFGQFAKEYRHFKYQSEPIFDHTVFTNECHTHTQQTKSVKE